MFSTLKKLTNTVTATEKHNVITVEGINTYVINRDITKLFGSGRINANIFITLDRSSFSFPSYFAPDVYFILDELTKSHSTKSSFRTLSKIKLQLKENTWLRDTDKEYPSRLNLNKLKEMTLTPLEFQMEFIKAYDLITQQYDLNGYLLAGAAGSGKTFTSLALMHCYEIETIYVVCPGNAVQEVWEKNILNKFKNKQTYWHSRMSTPPKGTERFIIVHYEAINKLLEYSKLFSNKKCAVLLDESHNLNETTSIRTNLFIDLCKLVNAKHVVWLSGTPIKAVATESIPLFRCIDKKFDEDAEARFKKIFGKSGTRGVEILNHRLGIVSFYVEKKELNLKDPIFNDIKIQMPNSGKYTLPEIRKVMSAFIKERYEYYKEREVENSKFFYSQLDWFEKTLTNRTDIVMFNYYKQSLKIVIKSGGDFSAKAEIMYCNKYELKTIIPALQQDKKAQFKDIRSAIKYVGLKIQGECLGRIVGGLRVQCHVDMVNYIDFQAICQSTLKKVVFFTSYVEVVETALEKMKKEDLNPIAVYGKTSHNLVSIIATFAKDESIDPLVATYKSLSTAVPLTMCDTAVMLDAPFRDYQLQQAISRVHRLDSDSKDGPQQTYIYTVSLDTGDEVNISTRSFDILKWSQDQVKQITGITSPFMLTDDPTDMTTAMESYTEEPTNVPSYLSW